MKKTCLVAFVLCLATVKPAKASLFGEENAFLAEMVALHLEEVTHLSTLITNAKTMLSYANELGATVRQAYRIYEIIKNYSLKDLLRDVKAGLFKAFPQARELFAEADLLRGNVRSLERGTFLGRRDYHDAKARRLINSSYRYALRSTIYPLIFPEATQATEEPSQVDSLVQSRIQRAGMNFDRAVKDSAFAVLAKKSQALVEDAEYKRRSDLQAAAINAQANVQAANDTSRLLDFKKLDIATQEAQELAAKEEEEQTQKELGDNVHSLFSLKRVVR